jgi:cell division protein FtsB
LLDDEYKQVFKSLDKLKRRFTSMKNEICKLRAKNNRLNVENEDLRRTIDGFRSSDEGKALLDKQKQAELKYISELISAYNTTANT